MILFNELQVERVSPRATEVASVAQLSGVPRADRSLSLPVSVEFGRTAARQLNGSVQHFIQQTLPHHHLWRFGFHGTVCGRGGGPHRIRGSKGEFKMGRSWQEQNQAGESCRAGRWNSRLVKPPLFLIEFSELI